MKLYRKEIMVKDWGYDDYSSGRVILNWTREEDFKGVKGLNYRYEYRIIERYIPLTEKELKEMGLK